MVQSLIQSTKQGSKKSSRVLQIVLRGGEGGGGERRVRNFAEGGSIFLLSGRNLRRSEFYHLNFFKGKNNIL